MLRWNWMMQWGNKRGDTLIEVTFALAILGFVLLGSTAIAAAALRMGQTARERTQVSEVAQEQMEALRSFRDNHSWTEFRTGNNCGSATGFCGIDQVLTTTCQFDSTKQCFHMVQPAPAGSTEWYPQTGSMAAGVPTSVVEISTSTANVNRVCGYDFELHYSFSPLGGGGSASNHITTRLVNLKYDPSGGPVTCP